MGSWGTETGETLAGMDVLGSARLLRAAVPGPLPLPFPFRSSAKYQVPTALGSAGGASSVMKGVMWHWGCAVMQGQSLAPRCPA